MCRQPLTTTPTSSSTPTGTAAGVRWRFDERMPSFLRPMLEREVVEFYRAKGRLPDVRAAETIFKVVEQQLRDHSMTAADLPTETITSEAVLHPTDPDQWLWVSLLHYTDSLAGTAWENQNESTRPKAGDRKAPHTIKKNTFSLKRPMVGFESFRKNTWAWRFPAEHPEFHDMKLVLVFVLKPSDRLRLLSLTSSPAPALLPFHQPPQSVAVEVTVPSDDAPITLPPFDSMMVMAVQQQYQPAVPPPLPTLLQQAPAPFFDPFNCAVGDPFDKQQDHNDDADLSLEDYDSQSSSTSPWDDNTTATSFW